MAFALPIFAAFSYVLWLFGDATRQRYAAPMFVVLSDGLLSGMDWATGSTRPATDAGAMWCGFRDGLQNAGCVVLWVNLMLLGVLAGEHTIRKWRGKGLVGRDTSRFLLVGGLSIIAALLCSCALAWYWSELGVERDFANLASDVRDAAGVGSVVWIVWACLEGVLPTGRAECFGAGQCTGCGYERGDLPVCPECRTATAAVPQSAVRRRRSRASWLLLCVLPPMVLAGMTFPWWWDQVYGSMPFMLQDEVSELVHLVPRWKP